MPGRHGCRRRPVEGFACGVEAEPGRLAGWWARPGPGVLTNPYADQAVVEGLEAYVWDVVVRLTPRLGERLGELTGIDRDARYWETLLQPWLVHVVSAVCDRRLAILAADRVARGLPVEGNPPFDPPANADASLRLLYTTTGNGALMAMLAQRMGHPFDIRAAEPPAGPAPALPAAVASRRARLRRLPRAPRAGAEVLVRAALGVAPGRRVAAVGLTRLPPLGMLRLARRVGLRTPPRGLRLLPVQPVPPAPPAQPRLRERLDLTSEDGGLEDVVGAALPALLPRTLLEGLPEVARLSEALYGKTCPAVAGNYSVAEVENDFLGRCRADGHRLGFAQHGGVYMQARVHAQERLELRPDGVYFSWGGRDGPARPTGSPHLERIRDTHVGGEAITVVEGLEPRIRTSFATGATAREPGIRAGGAAGRGRRERRTRRARPHGPAALSEPEARPRRPAALEALSSEPKLGLTQGGDAVEWMQRSRIALIGYLGTPLLEAVTIGVPFVVLWDLDRGRARRWPRGPPRTRAGEDVLPGPAGGRRTPRRGRRRRNGLVGGSRHTGGAARVRTALRNRGRLAGGLGRRLRASSARDTASVTPACRQRPTSRWPGGRSRHAADARDGGRALTGPSSAATAFASGPACACSARRTCKDRRARTSRWGATSRYAGSAPEEPRERAHRAPRGVKLDSVTRLVAANDATIERENAAVGLGTVINAGADVRIGRYDDRRALRDGASDHGFAAGAFIREQPYTYHEIRIGEDLLARRPHVRLEGRAGRRRSRRVRGLLRGRRDFRRRGCARPARRGRRVPRVDVDALRTGAVVGPHELRAPARQGPHAARGTSRVSGCSSGSITLPSSMRSWWRPWTIRATIPSPSSW